MSTQTGTRATRREIPSPANTGWPPTSHRHHSPLHSLLPCSHGRRVLEFLQALIATSTSDKSPSPVEEFLGSHPAAKAFVTAPKPTPSSFSREAYFGVNAFKFIDKDGKGAYFRYQIHPDAGVDVISASELAKQGTNLLHEDLHKRFETRPITFTLRAQLAEDGDVLDDATVHWPKERRVVDLGTIKLDHVVEDVGGPEQKKIIFDPIPRVDGLGVSDDPLLEMRAGVYLISGNQRRQAPVVA